MVDIRNCATVSWTASLAAGAVLALLVSIPWDDREEFDGAAAIAYVLDRIETGYVRPVDSRQLAERSLTHLVEGLDRWSAFIPPGEFADFDEEAEGRFGGVGIVFKRTDRGFAVEMVLRGGPADRSGVVPGDELVSADGVELMHLIEEEVKRQIRGQEGTAVRLVLRSPDGTERELVIVREVIHEPSVYRVALLSREPCVGYLRIERFQRETQFELDRAIQELLNAGIESVVLDLRENPGGLYNEAVAVVDRFLSEGVVVSTQGRGDPEKRPLWATAGDEYPSFRIVILINARSASAAEIVAAALREHGKAVLVGDRSYGKCSVQSVYQIFGNGSVWGALKLTTKRYFTPDGSSLSNGGLSVDVAVKQEDKDLIPLRAHWQESLRRSWNDPTRLNEDILDMEDDACLREALAVLADPARYNKILAGGEAGGDGREGLPASGDQRSE